MPTQSARQDGWSYTLGMKEQEIIDRIDKEIAELKPFGFRTPELTEAMKQGLEIAKRIILTGDCGHTR